MYAKAVELGKEAVKALRDSQLRRTGKGLPQSGGRASSRRHLQCDGLALPARLHNLEHQSSA
jgi:hypothetical protein